MRWLLLLLLIPGVQACDVPELQWEGFSREEACRDAPRCDGIEVGQTLQYEGTLHYIVPVDDCAFMPQDDVVVTLQPYNATPGWLDVEISPERIDLPLATLYDAQHARADGSAVWYEHEWQVAIDVTLRGMPNATDLAELAKWENTTVTGAKATAETEPWDAFGVQVLYIRVAGPDPVASTSDQSKPEVRSPSAGWLAVALGAAVARRFSR